MAKHFIINYQKAKHPIKGLHQQRDIFEKQVKPLLGDGKVAYVWVDALRFEMARELCRSLKDDFELEIQPAIGTIPTITEIGMAALLPKANESSKVVAVGGVENATGEVKLKAAEDDNKRFETNTVTVMLPKPEEITRKTVGVYPCLMQRREQN